MTVSNVFQNLPLQESFDVFHIILWMDIYTQATNITVKTVYSIDLKIKKSDI